jgi:hypothetical protein
LAEAVAAIPPNWQHEAFQAAERSYLRVFWQLELSGPQTWASSVMRRLRRRVREAEKEKLKKLYEQLSANEHRSALPFGQAHIFATHEATSSEEQKNVGGELFADEQIGQAHSFATHEAASSEEQTNVGRERFDDAGDSFGAEGGDTGCDQGRTDGEVLAHDVVEGANLFGLAGHGCLPRE